METLKATLNQTDPNTQCSLKEDEYIAEDGLIHCKNCGGYRQRRVMGILMHCVCKCEAEKRKKEQAEQELREKQWQIERLRKASLLGEKYRDATFENTEISHSKEFKVIYDRCRKYCEVSAQVLKQGTGIYLFGTKGTGKSRLTACMGNELMGKHYTVLYTNFTEIAKKILHSNEDFIGQISRIDFLFIDDFGTEKVTKGNEDMWLQEKVFEVINRRYINNKPTIFTSNYSLEELIRDRGMADKTVDRIMEMCEIMKLEGQSYRVVAMRNRERLF